MSLSKRLLVGFLALVIVTFGGSVFKVQSLNLLTWLYVVAFTATVLVFHEAARRVRLAMK